MVNAIQNLLHTFRLAAQKEQFLEKKETLMKEIHTKKEFLDSLQPRLENILKVKKISYEEIECSKKKLVFEEFLCSINQPSQNVFEQWASWL